MNFQDEIAQTIELALQEQREEEEREHLFDSEWLRLRESLILPRFQDAARAFHEKLRAGYAGFSNGSVVLSTKWLNREHSLTFRPNKNDRLVICSSSYEDDEDESFSLENLTEEVVKGKVQAFAYRVVSGKKITEKPAKRGGLIRV